MNERKRKTLAELLDSTPVDETVKHEYVLDCPRCGHCCQKREWVGLTVDEIWKCNKAETGSAVLVHICSAHQNVMDFAEAIEAKLKEKNQ